MGLCLIVLGYSCATLPEGGEVNLPRPNREISLPYERKNVDLPKTRSEVSSPGKKSSITGLLPWIWSGFKKEHAPRTEDYGEGNLIRYEF